MAADEHGVGRPGDWARKHYKPMIVVRVLLAPWILFVTVFLCANGIGYGDLDASEGEKQAANKRLGWHEETAQARRYTAAAGWPPGHRACRASAQARVTAIDEAPLWRRIAV